MKNSLEMHPRLFGIVGGVIAFVIAVVYLKAIPAEVSSASGLQKIILTYGHSLCWILLSGASSLWAITEKNDLSKILAYTALVVYVIFISTLLLTKFL